MPIGNFFITTPASYECVLHYISMSINFSILKYSLEVILWIGGKKILGVAPEDFFLEVCCVNVYGYYYTIILNFLKEITKS